MNAKGQNVDNILISAERSRGVQSVYIIWMAYTEAFVVYHHPVLIIVQPFRKTFHTCHSST